MWSRALAGTLSFVSLCAFGQPLSSGPSAIGRVLGENRRPLPTTPTLTSNCLLTVMGNGTFLVYLEQPSHSQAGAMQERILGCVVAASAPGYRSARKLVDGSTVDLVLKKLGEGEGSTVSVTELQVPKEARKAYDSGSSALWKRQFDRAVQDFRRSVEVDPAYSEGWCGLGLALEQLLRNREAEQAYLRAIQADPRYLKPYADVAALLAGQQRWTEAREWTRRALALNPVEFPAIYLLDAVANREMGDAATAEASARKAVEADVDHAFPASERVLGELLEARGELGEALQRYRLYLRLAPRAADADSVRARAAKLERRISPGLSTP